MDELEIYKQAVMDLIHAVGGGPYSISPHSSKPCKYVWMVHGYSPCDIRRYAYSHREAVQIVDHRRGLKGWNLYKLVRVNKRKSK
jgi:hypothetical protein